MKEKSTLWRNCQPSPHPTLKKSHLRAGVELAGHFHSQDSKHKWLEPCACDHSGPLSINNTCHFCSTEAVTYCSKWLSMQGPACSPRVHFSSIPNLKGPSSIRPATIATRPWPWGRRPLRSCLPVPRKPEVRARASTRYVQPWALCLGWAGLRGSLGAQETAGGHLRGCSWLDDSDFLERPQNFPEIHFSVGREKGRTVRDEPGFSASFLWDYQNRFWSVSISAPYLHDYTRV